MAKDLAKSSSNLNDIVYGGRPRNEEPHVKKTTKKKSEKVEYIVRVDLEELNIDDDAFEDLQGLYRLFDLDRDGILNFKEYEKLLRCLGYRLGEMQARDLAATVSVDKTNHSVSFNEFLKFFSEQKTVEPDEETLVEMFASFDKCDSGFIAEDKFKQIMSAKDDVNEEDISEMLDEYYRLAKLKGISTSRPEGIPPEPEVNLFLPPPPPKEKRRPSKVPNTVTSTSEGSVASKSTTEKEEKWIDYKEFAAMLQQ